MSSNEISKNTLGISAVQKAAVDSLTVGSAICEQGCSAGEEGVLASFAFFGASDWQFLAATGADGEETKVPDGWHSKK